ncbi:MAG: glycosyltransferase family 4 protein, partial [Candidatus Promineifilaceae bacterium]
ISNRASAPAPAGTTQAIGQKSGLRVAYAIQNVGGIDFSQDLGDTVPVKQTLLGLGRAGHEITCFLLRGREVERLEEIANPPVGRPAPQGMSGSAAYRLVESGARRLQRRLGLPYLALFDSRRFYEALRRCLPAYDLCHEHNGLLSIGAALASWRSGVPYVLTLSADPFLERQAMGRPLRGVQGALAGLEARLSYRLAQRIICVSKPAKRYLSEAWRVDEAKIVVLPNGVDTQLFSANSDGRRVRERLGLGEAPVVAFVGAFQPWHGVEKLVASFAQVVSELPDAHLLLVGDGRARPEIEREIEAQRLEAAVSITGLVAQSRVPELLAAADVAVLPYPQLPKELWFSPLKLYEYMGAGKAIVASRSGQIAEVIEDGQNGVLVAPGDVPALAQAIARLLRDPAERDKLGANARQTALERHSWAEHTRRLEDVYRSVL